MSSLQSLVNPYYSIGYLHNQGADYIGQNLLCFERLPTWSEVIINLAANFISKSNVFGEIPYINLKTAASYALDYNVLDIYPKDFTENQITYAGQILAIFDEYETLFDHIPEINTSIDNLVENILNSELSEEEQIPLLSGLAISKSSLYYWNQQFINPNSYWSQINNRQASQNQAPQNQSLQINWPIIHWGKVLKADAKGLVGGFLKSIFTGTGAVAGATAGAVTASAVELATQIYDYYFGNK